MKTTTFQYIFCFHISYVFSVVSCPSSCYRKLTFGDGIKKDNLICLKKTSVFQITDSSIISTKLMSA